MGKVDRVKKRTKRYGKRKFYGNQHTIKNDDKTDRVFSVDENLQTPASSVNNNDVITVAESDVSLNVEVADNVVEVKLPLPCTPKKTVSQNKVQHIATDTPKQSDPNITGYRIMDVEILSDIFCELNCPSCNTNKLKLHERLNQKKGLASLLVLNCNECDYEREFYSSQLCRDKFFDVNTRIVYAMRSIGQGYSSIEKFNALMNLPKPMAATSYEKTVSSLLKASHEVAEETMKEAAEELKDGDEVKDVGISADGSWQRRGFSSLNGTYTALSLQTGKILDCEVMSRYCKPCKKNEHLKKSNPSKYQKWMKLHAKYCTVNHVGCAGAMEVTGATRIFERSIKNRGLRYTEYLGDGDSKGFESVAEKNPALKLKKLE